MAKKKTAVQIRQAAIEKLLKKQGKFRPEHSIHALLLASVLVKIEELEACGYDLIDVEVSREGNERNKISAAALLFEKLHNMAARDLRALGMNFESKEPKDLESDGLSNFLSDFANDAG